MNEPFRIASLLLVGLICLSVSGCSTEPEMTDHYGNPFAVGSELQSTQSLGKDGIVDCIKIEQDVAVFRVRETGEELRITQQSIDSLSSWIVSND
jgi:hypothetical protein